MLFKAAAHRLSLPWEISSDVELSEQPIYRTYLSSSDGTSDKTVYVSLSVGALDETGNVL